MGKPFAVYCGTRHTIALGKTPYHAAGRVLVVDDEPDALGSLALVLEWWGYDVTTASSGSEAVSRVCAPPVDLVLTDLSMPGMDGVELCRRLRAMPTARDIPIIAVSALPQLPAALEGLVDAFLRKPVDFERLRHTLAAHPPR